MSLHGKSKKLSVHTLLFILFVIIAIGGSFFPLRTLTAYLSWPYPIEHRDAATLDIAMAIHEGVNPYAIENYPEYIYVYGGVLPLLTAFCLQFLRPSFRIMLGIDILFLVAVLCLMTWLYRRKIQSRGIRWGAILFTAFSMIVFAVLNFKVSGTRPSLPGLFFLLLTVIIPEQTNYCWKGLVCSAVCSFIAFNCKQYFLIGFPIVCLSLFLFQSKKKGILFGLFSTVGMVGMMLLLNFFFPLYINSTIWHHLFLNPSYNFLWMCYQLIPFCLLFWFGITESILAFPRVFPAFKGVNIKNISSPFFNQHDTDSIYLVAFLTSIICFCISMGGNWSNQYTYFIDLPLPFLLLSTFLFLSKRIDQPNFIRTTAGVGGLLFLFFFCLIQILYIRKEMNFFCIGWFLLLTLLFIFHRFAHRDVLWGILILSVGGIFFFQKENFITRADLPFVSYAQFNKALDQCQSILLSPEGYQYQFTHDTVRFSDNGHRFYAGSLIYPERGPLFGLYRHQSETLRRQLDNWDESLVNSLVNQEFDCITVTEIDPLSEFPELAEYYRVKETFQLTASETTTLYVPINLRTAR